MATIRKRVLKSGAVRWLVAYKDGKGDRRFRQFKKKKVAEEWMTTALFEVQQGVHTPASTTVTVSEAADRWLRQASLDGLERGTISQYKAHVTHHIVPIIGAVRLVELDVAAVKEFRNRLMEGGRSPAMVKKIVTSLGSLLAEAHEDRLVARNVVRELSRGKKRGRATKGEGRHKRRIEVGVEIPAPEDIRAIIAALEPGTRFRAFMITAIFTGLRSSELRGLPWSCVKFEENEVWVRQRADNWRAIGSTKSRASNREVPMTPMVKNTLLDWRDRCPTCDLDLVFPTAGGKPDSAANIWVQRLSPLLCDLGLTVDTGRIDSDGQPILRGKYSLHCFRHFYASWLINRRRDGGLEMPAKVVQDRLGHSSVNLTMDVYSHLFPSEDGFEEMAEAEKALLAAV